MAVAARLLAPPLVGLEAELVRGLGQALEPGLAVVPVLAVVPGRVWTPRVAQAAVKVAVLVALVEEVGLRPLRPPRLAAPPKV